MVLRRAIAVGIVRDGAALEGRGADVEDGAALLRHRRVIGEAVRIEVHVHRRAPVGRLVRRGHEVEPEGVPRPVGRERGARGEGGDGDRLFTLPAFSDEIARVGVGEVDRPGSSDLREERARLRFVPRRDIRIARELHVVDRHEEARERHGPPVDEGHVARIDRREGIPHQREHLPRSGEADSTGARVGRGRKGAQAAIRLRAACAPRDDRGRAARGGAAVTASPKRGAGQGRRRAPKHGFNTHWSCPFSKTSERIGPGEHEDAGRRTHVLIEIEARLIGRRVAAERVPRA